MMNDERNETSANINVVATRCNETIYVDTTTRTSNNMYLIPRVSINFHYLH